MRPIFVRGAAPCRRIVASRPSYHFLPPDPDPPLRARRLSVVSDNKLVEGVATLGAVDREDAKTHPGENVVRIYGGVSKKGYAPYNPRKRNQDSMVMEEHKPTGTLVFAVFDGHGEAGDLVSHYFADRVPPRLFAHPKWSTDTGAALVDELDRLEKLLLAGARALRAAAARAAGPPAWPLPTCLCRRVD